VSKGRELLSHERGRAPEPSPRAGQRPPPPAGAVQRKTSAALTVRQPPAAPPVYRPQTAKGGAQPQAAVGRPPRPGLLPGQSATGGGRAPQPPAGRLQRPPTPTPPSVPRPAPRALQAKPAAPQAPAPGLKTPAQARPGAAAPRRPEPPAPRPTARPASSPTRGAHTAQRLKANDGPAPVIRAASSNPFLRGEAVAGRAGARGPAPRGAVQRKVIIEEYSPKALPPTGKRAKLMWEDLKSDLLNEGISPHGPKNKHYTSLFKQTEELRFKTEDEFRAFFMKKLLKVFEKEEKQAAQERADNVPKNKRAKRTVRKFSMARPTWPEDYRVRIDALPGEDIRHVVRNATLKRALEFECEELKKKLEFTEITSYYQEMADKLGVARENHFLPQIKAIYTKLYLHLGNLFPGPGGVNQAIGFSADPITEYGRELLRMGDKPVKIDLVCDKLNALVQCRIKSSNTKASKMDEETALTFTRGLKHYESTMRNYISSICEYWIMEHGTEEYDGGPIVADAEDLGDDILDIGDNLGFDMILTDNATGVVAERHKLLASVERRLQSRKFNPGTHELTAIFKDFLRAPGQRKAPDRRTTRAGLTFPVSRVEHNMRGHYKKSKDLGKKKPKVADSGAIYLAAVLEYLTAELVETAGAKAEGNKRKRIIPSHFKQVFAEDAELNKVFGAKLQEELKK
jgi:hypothetical protein